MATILYENPSFYAHVINGILLLVAFIMLYINYSKIRGMEPYNLILMILAFSLATGVHGLSHMAFTHGFRTYIPL
jgi:thiol:disulfide interchange protein